MEFKLAGVTRQRTGAFFLFRSPMSPWRGDLSFVRPHLRLFCRRRNSEVDRHLRNFNPHRRPAFVPANYARAGVCEASGSTGHCAGRAIYLCRCLAAVFRTVDAAGIGSLNSRAYVHCTAPRRAFVTDSPTRARSIVLARSVVRAIESRAFFGIEFVNALSARPRRLALVMILTYRALLFIMRYP